MSQAKFLFPLLISCLLSCVSFCAIAEDSKPVLIAVISFDTHFLDAKRGLAAGLEQSGYGADRVRYAVYDLKKDLSLVPGVVRELKQQHCDLIVTTTTPVVLAVKKAMLEVGAIPLLFTMVADPVGSRVVPSLQSPGDAITGISYNAFAMMPKRLELFREAFPDMENIAVFYDHSTAWLASPVRENILPAAQSLGFQVIQYDVRSKKDMVTVTQQLAPGVEGLFMVPDPLNISFFGDLLDLSRKKKLPIMVIDNMLLKEGGVLGYSPSFYSIGLQAAGMAAKILNGTSPGRLSVQNANAIQLIVSLKEADRLALKLSDSLLSSADILLR